MKKNRAISSPSRRNSLTSPGLKPESFQLVALAAAIVNANGNMAIAVAVDGVVVLLFSVSSTSKSFSGLQDV